MRVLLTSAGLETEEIKACFVDMAGKDMAFVKALFIPTAAIDAGAIGVLPKCMNDLLKCGILDKNIDVYDLHAGMEFEKLQQYDVVYLCGGNTRYLLERINATGFHKSLIHSGGCPYDNLLLGEFHSYLWLYSFFMARYPPFSCCDCGSCPLVSRLPVFKYFNGWLRHFQTNFYKHPFYRGYCCRYIFTWYH